MEKLRSSILNLATVETTQLRNWLRHVGLGGATKPEPVTSPVEPPPTSSGVTLAVTEPYTPTSTTAPAIPPVKPDLTANLLVQENQLLLQYLTLYIISDTRYVS